jgi:hypothetical protein
MTDTRNCEATTMLGFQPSDEQITDNVLEGAEMLLGIRYPGAYREIIREFSGASGDVEFRVDRPSPGFDVCGVGLLHSLLPWSSESVDSRLSSWLEHGLSERIVPFGEDGGGNYVCFDYRQADVPRIVYYFHELYGDDGIMDVCESFDEFLRRLQLPNDG